MRVRVQLQLRVRCPLRLSLPTQFPLRIPAVAQFLFRLPPPTLLPLRIRAVAQFLLWLPSLTQFPLWTPAVARFLLRFPRPTQFPRPTELPTSAALPFLAKLLLAFPARVLLGGPGAARLPLRPLLLALFLLWLLARASRPLRLLLRSAGSWSCGSGYLLHQWSSTLIPSAWARSAASSTAWLLSIVEPRRFW